MQLHNMQLSHRVTRPCRKCKKPTPALKNGEIQRIVTCSRCSEEENKIFQLATQAANRQSRKIHHKLEKK